MELFKIEEYFLDIEKVIQLECDITKSQIYENYFNLISYSGNDSISKNGKYSLFISMVKSGYLRSIIQEDRDEKIVSVLT